MKRTILIFTVLLVAVSYTSAQLHFGLKAGYNSTLNLENLNSVKTGDYNLNSLKGEMSNGFHGGVFVRLGDKLYFQPELLYAMQKNEYEVSVSDVANPNAAEVGKQMVKFSTVDVPLLVGIKLLDLNLVNVRLFAGPKFRLNAGSSLDWENVSSTTINKLKGDFKSANVGLEAGAGIDVLMFTLDARFNLIKDMYQADWQSKPDMNSNLVISLGWKLF